jgi:hypothetical protein
MEDAVPTTSADNFFQLCQAVLPKVYKLDATAWNGNQLSTSTTSIQD